MESFLEQVHAELLALPGGGEASLAVAYSGGLDSTVLLNAAVRLFPTERLRALHVDHGLHGDSVRWEAHCRAHAARLGIRYDAARVDIGGGPGSGNIEARARAARYRALGAMLAPGEVLLTAHHADDQLETLLMRLLRGGGVAGLRGVVDCAPLAAGFVARPMLAISRAEIRAQAERWALDWLEDPANRDPRFDRSFLRGEIMGALRRRWPAAARAAVRTARQMRDAEEILAAVAQADLGAATVPGLVPQAAILGLSPARQRNLLRHLIARQGLPIPTAVQLAELEAALRVERPDARTTVRWPGAEARVYGGRLYLFAPLGARSPVGSAGRLASSEPWSGPEGRLELAPASAGAPGLAAELVRGGLEVRFRRGGERLAGAGRDGKSLKRFLKESGIVPWMRDRVPLLYRAERLVAVADLWYEPCEQQENDARCWRVAWSEHPPLR